MHFSRLPELSLIAKILGCCDSAATASGVRFFELLRGSNASGLTNETTDDKDAARRFKEYIRSEYLKIAALGDLDAEASGKAVAR